MFFIAQNFVSSLICVHLFRKCLQISTKPAIPTKPNTLDMQASQFKQTFSLEIEDTALLSSYTNSGLGHMYAQFIVTGAIHSKTTVINFHKNVIKRRYSCGQKQLAVMQSSPLVQVRVQWVRVRVRVQASRSDRIQNVAGLENAFEKPRLFSF